MLLLVVSKGRQTDGTDKSENYQSSWRDSSKTRTIWYNGIKKTHNGTDLNVPKLISQVYRTEGYLILVRMRLNDKQEKTKKKVKIVCVTTWGPYNVRSPVLNSDKEFRDFDTSKKLPEIGKMRRKIK